MHLFETCGGSIHNVARVWLYSNGSGVHGKTYEELLLTIFMVTGSNCKTVGFRIVHATNIPRPLEHSPS